MLSNADAKVTTCASPMLQPNFALESAKTEATIDRSCGKVKKKWPTIIYDGLRVILIWINPPTILVTIPMCVCMCVVRKKGDGKDVQPNPRLLLGYAGWWEYNQCVTYQNSPLGDQLRDRLMGGHGTVHFTVCGTFACVIRMYWMGNKTGRTQEGRTVCWPFTGNVLNLCERSNTEAKGNRNVPES